MRTARFIAGILAFFVVVLALEYPSRWGYFYGLRGCYQGAEAVGIMDPKGNLGGQVMGFNYQREPAWVHPAAAVVSATVAFAPAVLVGVIVMRWVAGTARTTRCGACNSVLRGLKEAKCPSCGGGFGDGRVAPASTTPRGER